jgi:hypothetical protein
VSRAFRAALAAGVIFFALLLNPRAASAELVLLSDGSWQVFTDGRVGGFVSWVHGDGYPTYAFGRAPDGTFVTLHDIRGGGWGAVSENHLLADPNQPPTATDQGAVNTMRVRSGMIGNIFGFGVRNQLSSTTRITAYLQFSSFIENVNQLANSPVYTDVQQGFLKLEAPWGTLLAGRVRELFTRGALDIDVLYGHTWGVGFPAPINSHGPTFGQAGFGLIGNEFGSGVTYATPSFAGLVLTVGVFDPLVMFDTGSWVRTKSLRPESELTFERDLGTLGRFVLFVDGTFQKIYRVGVCNPAPQQTCDGTVTGIGYGGRLELGPLRVGASGYYGKGLGLDNPPDTGDAAIDLQGNFRVFDGYYAQVKLVLGSFELSSGAGVTRIFLTASDKETQPDPRDPTGTAQVYPHSWIKSQLGINASAVYNLSPNIHFDLDYFRAQANWYLGEQQIVHALNSGMTFSW